MLQIWSVYHEFISPSVHMVSFNCYLQIIYVSIVRMDTNMFALIDPVFSGNYYLLIILGSLGLIIFPDR